MIRDKKANQAAFGEAEVPTRNEAVIKDSREPAAHRQTNAPRRAIEIVASDVSLDDSLRGIAAAIEADFPDVLCSILLADEIGARLVCSAAESLPTDYNQTIDGMAIGPTAGPFGAAAYRRDFVIVEDIANDSSWRSYRDVALRNHLRAFWSHPILSARGQLLGTFAMYFREPRRPGPEQLDVVRAVAPLAAIAIERSRMQERLSEIREQFDLVCNATNDVVWDWDVTRDRLWWSQRIQTLFGYSTDELEPGVASRSNRIRADDHARVDSSVREALASDARTWSEEYHFKRRDGTYAYVHDRAIVIRDDRGTAVRVVGAVADITERTRVEEALRESERTFATLLSNLPGAVYRSRRDAHWSAEFVSDGVEALTGYPPSDFLHNVRAFRDLIHPDDLARIRQDSNAAIDERRPFTNTYRIITASGEQKWIWGQGRGVYGRDGELLFIEGFVSDITELKRAEEALRESRSRLRLAVQGANVGLWDWHVQTNDLYMSPEWKRQLGYAEDEISDRSEEWRNRVHPDDLERVEAAVQRCLDGRTPIFESEFRMRHKDGSYRWIYARAEPIRGRGNRPVRMLGCHIDLTERKRTEEATARHAARHETLAALGQFALGHRELDELMSRAVTDLASCLNLEYAKILQHVPEERTLLLRARHGWDASHPARVLYGDRPESLASYCLRHELATTTEDFTRETRFAPNPFEAESGVRSAVAVVIHGGPRPYGVLSAHSKSARRFSADEVSFVQSVANVLAAAIERREAEQRLAQLAQFDPLTGLPNRNLFRDRLNSA
ncbi:MAG: PAS domain-containing protein, partial [Sulfurifustis sp.]